mgnify:CR=1 FL=1
MRRMVNCLGQGNIFFAFTPVYIVTPATLMFNSTISSNIFLCILVNICLWCSSKGRCYSEVYCSRSHEHCGDGDRLNFEMRIYICIRALRMFVPRGRFLVSLFLLYFTNKTNLRSMQLSLYIYFT